MAIYVAGKYVHHIWHGGSMVQYMYNGGTQLNGQEFVIETIQDTGFIEGYGTISPTAFGYGGTGYPITMVGMQPFGGGFTLRMTGTVPQTAFSRIVVALSPGDGSEQTIFKDYLQTALNYSVITFEGVTSSNWISPDLSPFFPEVPTHYFVTIYE